MVRTSRVVPKEWVSYAPMGVVIPNTRFIIFKTPLNEKLCKRIPRESRFTLMDLFRKLAERNERLGLLVDLTDTTRYYDRRDVEGMCVEYEKLFCPGRGFVDRDDVVQQFSHAIQRFIDRSDDKKALIGVHCTRGVNRSGYLVCRFLIDILGWSSHEAIDAFEKARGYAIEKGSYVQALHKAAKESRSRLRYERAESDTESAESKKARRKERKRQQEEMGGKAKEMGDMIKHFFGVLGQEASQLESAASPVVERPRWQSEEMMEDEEEEEEEGGGGGEGEGEVAEGWQLGGVVEGAVPTEESLSSKRRARRKRLQNMFHVMKKGKFHEIREMHKEKYGL